MKLLLPLLTAVILSTTGLCSDAPKLLDKVNVLPLALDDSFQFRKTWSFLYDPLLRKPTPDPMVNFMWQRMDFGLVSAEDRRHRYGHYYTFWWRSKRKADLTLRLEYRQQLIGTTVQAKELYYHNVKGTVKSEFNIIGDDYEEDGRVTGWRALLIENGKIVGLNASFLWN